MANLNNKTKAELIEIIERQERELNDIGLSPNEEMVIDFAEQLKTFFNGHQSGMLTKFEICHGINRVYDAFKFAKEVRKDED